ncbi:Exodeoxyribonuclease VII small subunit [Candidatus Bealeia paramacronuclearis]|uniref:Exodeoxyribonuclease 7 small subunit n=1 Tax=Candidatus Bealeia paramacronuclearis TaxID=1921001 RepID=A0ABZ2C3D7_9PROT|nr:Exodeoxyribonuclease VII small subunit [Candidatus Bealeia paramacronuclearis]
MSQEIEKLSFEDALKELETIVKRLEEGKVSLEDAITCYERGAQLKSHCEKKLRDAKMRVEQIVVGQDGQISTKPAEFN